ncbi:hypothetical protein WN59_10210 [Salinicoccus sediminis]|uniref:Uncharacterized protein n=1 Tax=Salinicoccus sediminis TaxID=1432562 RepID=A0A0M2SGW9_9STAP|nr:hypothetical protein [Salinicoccus sediminis]KKK33964.1 hypothetical protein WN59_10210 [Salinicoccus sediminis]
MNLRQYRKAFNKEFKKQGLSKTTIFKSIKLFNSKNLTIRNYSLKRDLFYYSKNVFVPNSNDFPSWNVEKNNIKMLYISYLTLNNNFAYSPDESFFNIEENEVYYIDISVSQSKNIIVTPIIIHYSRGKKTKLTKIIDKNQLLNFSNDEDKCRLTFKIEGSGDFSIENIKVLKLR